MWHDHTPPSEHTRVCVFLPCVAEIIFHHQNTKVMSLACMCSFPALQWSCASIIKQLSDSVCAFPGVTVICASVRTWHYQTCVCVCAFPCVTVIKCFHHKIVITLLCMCAFLPLQWCVPLNMTLSDSCACVPFLVLQWSSEHKIISLRCMCLSLRYSDQCLCQNMTSSDLCACVPFPVLQWSMPLSEHDIIGLVPMCAFPGLTVINASVRTWC